jgi:hypothetical protein
MSGRILMFVRPVPKPPEDPPETNYLEPDEGSVLAGLDPHTSFMDGGAWSVEHWNHSVRRHRAQNAQAIGCRQWHKAHRRIAVSVEVAAALRDLASTHGITEQQVLQRLLDLGWALSARKV